MAAIPRWCSATRTTHSRRWTPLELLVVNDLFVSATARHAHYVMAVKHPFERVDTPMLSDAFFPFSFNQYTEAMVEARDDVIEEWEFFWRLGQAMGTGFTLTGNRRGRDADRRRGDRRPQSRTRASRCAGESRLAERGRLRPGRAAGGRRDSRHARSCGSAPGRRSSRGHRRTRRKSWPSRYWPMAPTARASSSASG